MTNLFLLSMDKTDTEIFNIKELCCVAILDGRHLGNS